MHRSTIVHTCIRIHTYTHARARVQTDRVEKKESNRDDILSFFKMLKINSCK